MMPRHRIAGSMVPLFLQTRLLAFRHKPISCSSRNCPAPDLNQPFFQNEPNLFSRCSGVILRWPQLWELIHIANRERGKHFTKFYPIKEMLKPQSWQARHCWDHVCLYPEEGNWGSLAKVNAPAAPQWSLQVLPVWFLLPGAPGLIAHCLRSWL